MVLRKKGGIGAVGSPFAKFLHPSNLIRAKWPNEYKTRQCQGVVITGKGMHNVSRRQQLCYEYRVPGPVGEWEKQLVCPRKSNSAISDTIGVWKEKTWPMIATMSEFALFRLTFPEEFIKTVVIPATNQHKEGEQLTLNEFYVWLGCRFFMACFIGEYNAQAWWSSKPVSLWEGAPHRLNEFIDRERFEGITDLSHLSLNGSEEE